MANQRDDERESGADSEHQQTAGQQSHRSEYGAQGDQQDRGMATQGREGSFGGESSGRPADDDGMSGQPIGGNDSNTGSGTTLTAGYEPARSASESVNQDPNPGRGTTSNMGAPSLATSQTSGGSSGVSGGEGFIGSSASDSGDYVQDQGRATDMAGDSSSRAKGQDFAREGRGALDEDGAESGSSSSGSFTGGGTDSGDDESAF